MFLRWLLCLIVMASLCACKTPYKEQDKEDAKPLKDQSSDTTFQAFVGRLRIAVAKRDRATLTSMMAPNFGYRWDVTEPMPPEAAFDYWDEQNLWPELSGILRERFVAEGVYMVAPPPDEQYRGYRAGMRVVGGSWKFAYFVSGEQIQ